MSDRAREVARAFVDAARGTLGADIVQAYLFGSYARGEAHEESDVDVLLVVRGLTFARKRQLLDLAYDVGTDAGFHLSPTAIDLETSETWLRQERALVMTVAREGVPL